MPTLKYFNECPSFPSDIPVADIPLLSFKKLQDINDNESKRLFDACQEYGFFTLDLKDSEDGQSLLQRAEKMFDIANETWSLGQEELDKYASNPPRDLLGYKASGTLKTDDGNLDAMEMYNIGQDDILGNTPPRSNPAPVEAHREGCKLFLHQAHAAIGVILSHLDKNLGLPAGTLSSLTPLENPSDTSIRLLLSHPQSRSNVNYRRITLGGHTDIGTITLLFNVAGGLQILPAGSENVDANWRYVRPQLGCAVINIGDTMVEWTGGVLRSSLHRVVTAPGEQANVKRQSLAYLVRPDKNGSMRRLKGGNVIPPLAEGEQDETRSVSDWVSWRARQIMNGELKPQTRGGKLVSPPKGTTPVITSTATYGTA